MHVIDAVRDLGQSNKTVKVSDISVYLNVTRPSITKLVNEPEKMDVVQKIPDEEDRKGHPGQTDFRMCGDTLRNAPESLKIKRR